MTFKIPRKLHKDILMAFTGKAVFTEALALLISHQAADTNYRERPPLLLSLVCRCFANPYSSVDFPRLR